MPRPRFAGVVVPVTLPVVVVVAWTLLRVVELLLSEVNLPRLRASGAVESCRRGLLALLLVNALAPLLAMAALFAVERLGDGVVGFVKPVPLPVRWAALGLLVIAEAWHWWAIATLGRRWTVPVVVVPGEHPVERGPYRWMRHPGYLGGGPSAVLLPVLAGSWAGAAVEGVVMGLVVARRMRCEDAAWRRAGGGVRSATAG